MPPRSSCHPYRIFLDVIIVFHFLWIGCGLFVIVTHRLPPVFSTLSFLSYGMIAPYQADTDTNTDLAVVAWEDSGASTLLPVHRYFPGLRGERNSRMRLEKYPEQSIAALSIPYHTLLTQILLHERNEGHAYRSLDLYWEEWPRSPAGYDAGRSKSIRYFITTVR